MVADKLIWTSDGEGSRPTWTLAPAAIKDSADQAIRVVGMSNRHSTQKGARDAAMDDARRQIANYISSQVEDKVERIESGANTQSGVQDPVQELNRITRQLSVHSVNSMAVENSRFEQWLESRTGKTFFNAFVQASVSLNSLQVGGAGGMHDIRGLKGDE
tara:strand:+ start:729 stop:1208 length:480 start_codon:yes stop_codon:yes gene_type:complete